MVDFHEISRTDPECAEVLGLRAIEGMNPLYILPADSLVDDVLIPSFASCDRVDSMMGFFTSSALVDLAPGLATFINRSNGKLRLIISPVVREEDAVAIKHGVDETAATEIAERTMSNMVITPDAIERHTLKCLTWLIRQQRVGNPSSLDASRHVPPEGVAVLRGF